MTADTKSWCTHEAEARRRMSYVYKLQSSLAAAMEWWEWQQQWIGGRRGCKQQEAPPQQQAGTMATGPAQRGDGRPKSRRHFVQLQLLS